MAKIIDPKKGETVYDPSCVSTQGFGSFRKVYFGFILCFFRFLS